MQTFDLSRAELWAFIERKVREGYWLISCDLGHPHLERLENEYPERVTNIGIREQSAIGVATGLAKGGQKVLVYAIGNQILMRACEQLRFAQINELSFAVIGIGHGEYYGKPSGISHDADKMLMTSGAFEGFAEVAGIRVVAQHELAELDKLIKTTFQPLYLPFR